MVGKLPRSGLLEHGVREGRAKSCAPLNFTLTINMKKVISIIILLLPSIVMAGGPSMPDGYRRPNEAELASPNRDEDRYRYEMAVGDFNGDGLVDGALLAIDDNNKELAVFVFVCTANDQVYRWYKVASLEYRDIKYTGVKSLTPQTIYYYQDITGEDKAELNVTNDSFELFQFEGAKSVFYYEKESNQFKRVWISK
ncbi:MAG: hypothetical protein AB1545_01475 [Thermodesulfobacteriota bacterium]